MIKKCLRCEKLRHIHAKGLCHSCWSYEHRNKEKSLERSYEWARKNRKYFRDYQRKKFNTKPENYRQK